MIKTLKGYPIFSIAMLVCSVLLFGLYYVEAKKAAGLNLSLYDSKGSGIIIALYLFASLLIGTIGLISLAVSLIRRKYIQTK